MDICLQLCNRRRCIDHCNHNHHYHHPVVVSTWMNPYHHHSSPPYRPPIYHHNHLHDPTKFLSRSSTDRTCNCFFLAVHSQLRRFCDRRVEKILLLTKNYLEAYDVSRFAAYSTLLGIVHNCSLLKDETDGNIMLTSKIARQVFINHSAGALSVDWEHN